MTTKRPFTITEDTARNFNFKPEERKPDKIKFDEKFPRFGLRIRTSSDGKEHRSYIFQYKLAGKHRKLNCGTVASVKAIDARKAAQDFAASLVKGKDPANEKAVARKEASHTLGRTIAAYLEAKKSKLRESTYKAAEHNLNTLWKPLHGLAVGSIGRANITAQVRTIGRNSGPVAANRARASLSAMFRWAIGEGDCDENPVVGTNKLDENKPRDRALSDAEAAAVWLAAPDNDYGRIVRLALLTGCRRDELGNLQWPEVDLEARTITLPGSRTKNGQKHIVPLCDTAVEILKSIPRREDRNCVFGAAGTNGYSGWSKAKAKLDKAAKLETPWTLHDLRRTVRTGLSGLDDVSPWTAEAVLNHLPPKLVRTYAVSGKETKTSFDKKLEADKRAALEKWASHLAVAVAQATGTNVTRLPSRQT